MFDKVKQAGNLLKMRGEAQKLQKELKTITETYEKDGLVVKVDGANEVVYMKIDGVERPDVKDAVNKAAKDVQKKAAQKMMEMGGGLSGLLGKMGQ